ncbi:MAG: ribonuclease E/G [bacterium]
MSKQIVVNACLSETRVALLQEGQLTELFVERKGEAGITGNIYIGRVTKVLPGMQACFVDIGQHKDAFLYSSDIFDNMKDPEAVVEEGEENNELEELDEVQLSRGAREETEDSVPESGSAGIDEDPETIELACEAEEEPEIVVDLDREQENDRGPDITREQETKPKRTGDNRKRRNRRGRNRGRNSGMDKSKRIPIERLVKENQEVMVQVGKDSTGGKGARISSLISLPGRFLVYMPHSSKIRISRRIEKGGERNRLKKIMEELSPATGGFIVRTAAENKPREDLEADIRFLTSTWSEVLAKVEKAKAPCVLHEDLDLTLKTARDLLTPDIKKMIIDDRNEYERCKEFTKKYMERMTDRVVFFNRREPIFERYNVESQIEKAIRRKVWLRSGGYLVVDEAEALVAIDVNSGKYVGKSNLEDTVLKINLEAVQEVARQMKIRNLAGIIIIDLIDMEREDNRKKVLEALKRHLKGDRVRTNVHQLSDLGIVEMTRKRSRVSLGKTMLRNCPHCKGSGKVKSQITVFGMIQREIGKLARKDRKSDLMIRTHPDIADLFYDDKEELLLQLQRSYDRRIFVKSDCTMRFDQYDILTV